MAGQILPLPFFIFLPLIFLPSPGRAADTPSFSRDIRPILSQHCFKCHGPDEQKGRLRFDDRASATRPARSGQAIGGESRTGFGQS